MSITTKLDGWLGQNVVGRHYVGGARPTEDGKHQFYARLEGECGIRVVEYSLISSADALEKALAEANRRVAKQERESEAAMALAG